MSEIRVNNFKAEDGIGAPSFPNGINVTGVVTATTGAFSGAVSGTTGTFSGAVSGTTGTFSGNVSIGGTLTYEDVTNIDSVGIVTAREGIFIPDSKEIKLGNTAGSPDMKIHHDGNHSIIEETGTGNLFFKTTGSEISLLGDGGSDYMVRGIQNGAAELYHNAVKKLETASHGITVAGEIRDDRGNIRDIQSNPLSGAHSSHTLVASDAGKVVIMSGNLTLPAASGGGPFGGGSTITIINGSGSNITLTQGSGLTLYNTADGTTGNRTLAGRGMATVYYIYGGNSAYISGSGLS